MEIELPLPPTLNQTYRTGNGRYYMTKTATNYKQFVQWQLKRLRPTKDKYSVMIKMYVKHDRDIDSSLKILLDSFEGFVYENDRQIVSLQVDKIKVKDIDPKLVVVIDSVNSTE